MPLQMIFLIIIFAINTLQKSTSNPYLYKLSKTLMATRNQGIVLYDFSAEANFQWNIQDFPQILQALQLQVDVSQRENQQVVAVKVFEQYKKCKLILFGTGKMEILDAQSIQIVGELFKFCVITLMQKLPESNIVVATELKPINYSAIVDLGFELKLKKIQRAIQNLDPSKKEKDKQFQLQLPYLIHKIENITVVLESKHVKIKNCRSIKDLNLFRAYLISILYPFRKTKPYDFGIQYIKHFDQKRKTSKKAMSNSWKNLTQKLPNETQNQIPYFEQEFILKSQSYTLQ